MEKYLVQIIRPELQFSGWFRLFHSVFRFAVTNTVESRIDVRTILDSIVHSMEYRLGSAYAHDADSYLSSTNVRVESGKGKYNNKALKCIYWRYSHNVNHLIYIFISVSQTFNFVFSYIYVYQTSTHASEDWVPIQISRLGLLTTAALLRNTNNAIRVDKKKFELSKAEIYIDKLLFIIDIL